MIRSLIIPLVLALLVLVVIFGTQSMAQKKTTEAAMTPHDGKVERAIFAGGCFWCMEKPFESIDGVSAVISGYTGGEEVNPSYKQVASGRTGHLEAVEIQYDPSKVTYDQLLEVFWRQVNPTDGGGQFVDRGAQYGTGIFVLNDEQRTVAEASKKKMDASGRYEGPIVTPVREAMTFYPAEDYHQDYYKKSPFRYKFYRSNSGRDQYLKKVWGNEAKH